MKIVIANSQLRSSFRNQKSLERKFGQEMAKKILLRLNSLKAAESLAVFWPPYTGPERCHELKGNLEGFYSIDLKHPYRLLITPSEQISKTEVPNEVDRWKLIKEIEIRRIENTHD